MVEVFTRILRIELPDSLQCDESGKNPAFSIAFVTDGPVPFPQIILHTPEGQRLLAGKALEETVIEGGLDRDVIADVIKRNLGQIRYCYERQLSSNPDLYGKLLVKFTIDAGGGVMEPKIDTSTLKSSLVEGCVLRRMAGWKFPLPKGGTQVRVSYPFLFKALD